MIEAFADGEPRPAEAAVGEAFSISVTVLDIDGHTASTFVDTVHFASSDPAALLPDDYTFTPADGGTHTFTVILMMPGPQTIQVIDLGNRFHTDMATVTVDAPPAARPTFQVVEVILSTMKL